MKKRTLLNIILSIILLFIAERFYLIPYNVNLDMKPEGKRSAVYMAKTISRKANCDYSISLFESVFNIDKPSIFDCQIDEASFSFFIFYNKKEKQAMLDKVKQADKKNRLYSPCVKEGNYFLIFSDPSFFGNRYTSKPSLASKTLYDRFPGRNCDSNAT